MFTASHHQPGASARFKSFYSLLPIPCSLQSLQFEGVSQSFCWTSPFYFFAVPRSRPLVPDSLLF